MAACSSPASIAEREILQLLRDRFDLGAITRKDDVGRSAGSIRLLTCLTR